jgi:glycosyltransferase involved in cell wall biosynthesis
VRILILNWKDERHPSAGGAEVFLHEVSDRWARSGHEVRLVVAAVPGASSREVRPSGVEVRRAGSRFGVYRAARQHVLAEGVGWADVVLDSINTRPFLTPRWCPIPAVGLPYQVCREIWFDEMPLPVAAVGRWILEPRWLRAYRRTPMATISSSSRDSLRQYGIRDATVVCMGAHVSDPGPVEKAEVPTVAFVGRLSKNKRPADALEAFRLVRRALPAARLQVIGDGSLRTTLERAAPPGVEVLGRVSEIEKAQHVAAAHVLAVPSRREGWGLVVTEAAALGTPSVAYDVPGLRDSVAAAGQGLLVEPTPPALASGLLEQLRMEQPAFRSPLPSWDATASQLLGLLRRAVEPAGALA